jgi:inhibitor of cysteine peptidase
MGGKQRLFMFLAGIGAVLVILTTCSPRNEVKIDDESNNGQVELQTGQTLEVTLESNPTTGYAWEVAEVDESLLQSQGDAEYKEKKTAGEQLVGSGGTQTFRFTAAEVGETTLKLIYHRAWETDVEPVQTFSVQVTINP